MAADNFHRAYHRLEARMKSLAEAEGDIFLPNVAPTGPVDYVLIAMEPSLGRWANLAHHAATQVAAGFRNFISSVEDFLLHFSVQTYLCAPHERYHITDISKGAMLVSAAGIARSDRYAKWYNLLSEELAIVARPNARVIAVGTAVAQHLARSGFPRSVTKIIHKKGTGHHLGASSLICLMGDFNSWRVVQPVGMP